LHRYSGQGKNSVLYQQLVKTQKALQASSNSRLNELAGDFSIQLIPLPGKTLAAMDSLFTEALAAFEKRGVTDEDIEKFKGNIEAQYINGLQSVSGKYRSWQLSRLSPATPIKSVNC
jgi:zinc protease